jgi:hypothetical protein
VLGFAAGDRLCRYAPEDCRLSRRLREAWAGERPGESPVCDGPRGGTTTTILILTAATPPEIEDVSSALRPYQGDLANCWSTAAGHSGRCSAPGGWINPRDQHTFLAAARACQTDSIPGIVGRETPAVGNLAMEALGGWEMSRPRVIIEAGKASSVWDLAGLVVLDLSSRVACPAVGGRVVRIRSTALPVATRCSQPAGP